MNSKSELADQVAQIHLAVPGAWQGDDNQTGRRSWASASNKHYDDASKVVAAIDQGGLGLPNRDFYLKDDDKSKDILSKYEVHVAKMLVLGISGESATQALPDAKTVIAIETAMATGTNGQRRAARSEELNNKMSLKRCRR